MIWPLLIWINTPLVREIRMILRYLTYVTWLRYGIGHAVNSTLLVITTILDLSVNRKGKRICRETLRKHPHLHLALPTYRNTRIIVVALVWKWMRIRMNATRFWTDICAHLARKMVWALMIVSFIGTRVTCLAPFLVKAPKIGLSLVLSFPLSLISVNLSRWFRHWDRSMILNTEVGQMSSFLLLNP